MLERLDMPPDKSDSFFWSDFVELRALIHPDRCYSRGDLFSLEKRCRDFGISFDAEIKWREILNFTAQRTLEFSDSYPYEISSDKDTISLKSEEDTHQRTYLGLLVASCMRHVVDRRRGEVARDFEETCFVVFSNLMPKGAEIRATWANGGAIAPYKGPLYKKMQQVAADLRCAPNFQERDFKTTDTGDGGIDLISWHPMADNREGIPISFAQCGCSKEDWRFKQSEASFERHGQKLPVMHPWATYYFMPLDFRWADGGWAYKSDLGKTIIVDRLRLIRLATEYGVHDQLPPMTFVDEIRNLSYC
ncbi:MAG: hypothetical protein ACKVQK_31335 [Burkholderiales bacterium]